MKNSLNEILELKVSYQANTWASLSKELTIKDSLKLIQSYKYKSQIENLRILLKNGEKKEYDKHKITLPAVTFCATFNEKRRRENIKQYNSIIVIDIDKLEEEKLLEVTNILKTDPYVFTFWKSPSNKGLKGLVSIKFNSEVNANNVDSMHKCAFNKLALYFAEKYTIELDKSGSDTTRLCFFSFDDELILKKDFDCFKILENEIIINKKTNKERVLKIKHASNKDALFNPKDKNNQRDRKTISSILKFLERKNLSITNTYEKWYTIAMSISNTFTFDIGLIYFLRFSSIDIEKYNRINCTNFLQNCYESRNGTIKFNSLIHLANNKGYQTKQQLKKGSETEG